MVHPEEQHQVQHVLQHNVMLEGDMVSRNKYAAIQELARSAVLKKEIARHLKITVKTVRRALKKPQWKPYQRQKPEITVLSEFKQLSTSRAEDVSYNAAIFFRELKEQGYSSGYESVKRFTRPLRQEHQQRVDAVMRPDTILKQGKAKFIKSTTDKGELQLGYKMTIAQRQ